MSLIVKVPTHDPSRERIFAIWKITAVRPRGVDGGSYGPRRDIIEVTQMKGHRFPEASSWIQFCIIDRNSMWSSNVVNRYFFGVNAPPVDRILTAGEILSTIHTNRFSAYGHHVYKPGHEPTVNEPDKACVIL